MSIPEKLRQAYHNDLTDVPLLIDAADEIERLRAALESIHRRAYSYEHGDDRVRATFKGIADIAYAALGIKP